MKIIYSSLHKYPILVDDEDFDWLNQKKWSLNRGYAAYEISKGGRNNRIRHLVRMHRIILEHHGFNLEGIEIDHRNLNRLDNQKSNLRVATHNQNQWNVKKRKNNTSGYKGVLVMKNYISKPFVAYINVNNKRIHLGYFSNIKDAALSYNNAAKSHFGDFANLNSV